MQIKSSKFVSSWEEGQHVNITNLNYYKNEVRNVKTR